MCRICPNCGGIAEFSEYYGRVICTRCEWESEDLSRTDAIKYSRYPNKQETQLEDKKKLVVAN